VTGEVVELDRFSPTGLQGAIPKAGRGCAPGPWVVHENQVATEFLNASRSVKSKAVFDHSSRPE